MTTDMVRQTLSDARRLELLTGSFELSLQDGSRQWHPLLQLPRQRGTGALVNLVTNYIEQTLALVETVEEQARQEGVVEAAQPAIRAALAFFALPPLPANGNEPEVQPKLRQLMEQAYLAQRLLDEINDLVALWRNIRLIPFDITRVNLIIHQLIGEPHANRLDLIANRLAVEYLPLIRPGWPPATGERGDEGGGERPAGRRIARRRPRS